MPILNPTITAAILVGGLGTRLRPSLADRPKCLAQVAGRPFLGYLLDQLEAAGLHEVLLLTGYRAEQIHATLGERHGQMHLRYSHEEQPMGTGGALRQALPLIGPGPVLLLNGDSYCSVDFEAFVHAHQTQNAPGSIVLARVEESDRFGQVQVGECGLIRAFAEKQSGGSGWVNAGIYLLSRSLLEMIPEDKAVSLEREWFPQWAAKGGLRAYHHQGDFIDIGTPQSYAAAEEYLGGVLAR